MTTRPRVGLTRPTSIRIVVVFPAPFGPRKPNTSPRWSANDASDDDLAVAVALREPLGGQDDVGERSRPCCTPSVKRGFVFRHNTPP